MNNIENDPLTYAIIGSCMEVHDEIGPGCLEAVYHECLEIEFHLRNIPYISYPKLKICYKNQYLKKYYIPDFSVYDKIIVEMKNPGAELQGIFVL